jgi:hypothetical protein
VQITVSIRGGMMDDDRVTSIRGDQLIVQDHGKIRVNRGLTRRDVDQLERLANEVAGLAMSERRAHPKAVDSGITIIEIEADKSTRIELWAGEDAPEPVWALLSAIDALGRDAKVLEVLSVCPTVARSRLLASVGLLRLVAPRVRARFQRGQPKLQLINPVPQ